MRNLFVDHRLLGKVVEIDSVRSLLHRGEASAMKRLIAAPPAPLL